MNSVDAWLILSRLTWAIHSHRFGRRIVFECLGDSLVGHFKILVRAGAQHSHDRGALH